MEFGFAGYGNVSLLFFSFWLFFFLSYFWFLVSKVEVLLMDLVAMVILGRDSERWFQKLRGLEARDRERCCGVDGLGVRGDLFSIHSTFFMGNDLQVIHIYI